ncbi:MAG: DUF456 domain-containing protein [Treponema sp.]|jgi:uncharacterized protein YqgC (DUF456 family)|nr:DUF456 domain-containing protein [Treponema sp.]
MEIILIVVAFLFLLAGLVGSVVPAIPGPPLGYVGLLLLQWSGHGGFSIAFLVLWAAITIAVTVMDNFLPAWMTKRFGGSRMAVIGSVLGIIVGMFFVPIGLLIGPFLGALAGELINSHVKQRKEIDSTESAAADGNTGNALKVAFGAFLAFIVGTGAKLIIGALMIYYAVKAVF